MMPIAIIQGAVPTLGSGQAMTKQQIECMNP